MFDTLNLWIPREAIADTPDLAYSEYHRLVEQLNLREVIHNESIRHKGKFDNFYICIFDSGISLKGSLAKYYLGNNFDTLDIHSSKKALSQLATDLDIPILEAEVRRIDFSTNFILPMMPSHYFGYLLESSRTNRVVNTTSLNFMNKSKQIFFYDKVQWAKNKAIETPSKWIGKNVLRYEYRFMKNFKKKLGLKTVLAKDLIKPKTYETLLETWHTEYFKIKKKKEFIIDYYTITTPKDFFDMVLAETFKQRDYHEYIELIEQMKARNLLKNRYEYCRLKKKLTEHYMQGMSIKTSDPMKPLNEAVNLHYVKEAESLTLDKQASRD
jgi:hypothetical protein